MHIILLGLTKFENLMILMLLLSFESYFSQFLALPARVLPLYVLSNLLCLPLIHWGFVVNGNPLLREVIIHSINTPQFVVAFYR